MTAVKCFPRGVYVHIPFCLSKCGYCDFVSYANRADKQKPYVAALLSEIAGRADKRAYIDTVYFGGGTPSLLYSGAAADILAALRAAFTVSENAEITIEINPATASEDKIKEYSAAGVNRVSIGLQAKQEHLLKLIGRAHNYKDFLDTVKLVRKYIANISADMLLGLPAQTLADVTETARALTDLGIAHISAYALTLGEDTPLFKKIRAGELVLPPDELTADMYDAARGIFKAAGLARYEVSNFAKAGYECRHNLNYWKRGEYYGIGAAAHGFTDGARYENTSDIDAYISGAVGSLGGRGFGKTQPLNKDDEKFEYIMLALRTEAGIPLAEYSALFKEDFLVKYSVPLKKLSNEKLIEIKDGRVKAADGAFYLLNYITVTLL